MADSTFEVVRERTIDASTERVHDSLSDFHAWQAWSPWEGRDPEQSRVYRGADSGLGATYEWKGNRKVGQGRMEITGDRPTEVVVIIEFIKPFKATNTATFTLTPEGSGTHVRWSMVGPTTFMTKVMGIFKSMDKMIGPDFEQGLSQLDASLST
jgi:uncharacterized protein YndB with AHSA1/START domain